MLARASRTTIVVLRQERERERERERARERVRVRVRVRQRQRQRQTHTDTQTQTNTIDEMNSTTADTNTLLTVMNTLRAERTRRVPERRDTIAQLHTIQ